MTPRKYDLGKRAEAVEETKRRIIQATFRLHNRQGPAATTHPQVAKEADVALGTVYRYFPTIDDLVAGCGQHVLEVVDPPSLDSFDGVPALEDRVRLLTRGLFDMYRRGARPIAEARCQQSQFSALGAFVQNSRRHHEALVRQALRPARPQPRAIAGALALTDFYVWKAFTDAGLSANHSIDIVVSALLARLEGASARKGTRT